MLFSTIDDLVSLKADSSTAMLTSARQSCVEALKDASSFSSCIVMPLPPAAIYLCIPIMQRYSPQGIPDECHGHL